MKTVYHDGEGGVYIAKIDEVSIREYLSKGYVLVTDGALMSYLEDRSVTGF